jgi:hypothetical protein
MPPRLPVVGKPVQQDHRWAGAGGGDVQANAVPVHPQMTNRNAVDDIVAGRHAELQN